jgi:hypothetical protein
MSLGILENGTVLPFVANEIRIYKITIKKDMVGIKKAL